MTEPNPSAKPKPKPADPAPVHALYDALAPETRARLEAGEPMPDPTMSALPLDCDWPGPIVRLHAVHKAFGPTPVLAGVDLGFQRGEITVILGPSGTGKSVLLKHIVGLIKPDHGEVYFDNRRVDTLREADLVKIRKRIGYMFQLGALFDSMTVGDNVAFPLVEHTELNAEERRACVRRVLELVGLGTMQDKLPTELSGGQQRRVALARAVVLQPTLVLYDEPTTGLDPVRADVINELILALAKSMGISSIVVTHDMASANKIADRMILLHEGKVICDGRPEQFRASDNAIVQRFIHGEADEADLDAIRQAFESTDAGPGGGTMFNQRGAAQ
ncbi:MAG: ABC transporter ATP-binding protein [Phycisphaerales bacterium JB063]